MTSATVAITANARAILALDTELVNVIREIEAEKQRHNASMEVLLTKEHALETAIFKLGTHNDT